MIRSGKVSTTTRAAGGPCPGPRSGRQASPPHRWQWVLMVVCAAALVAPAGFIAPGCSSKPAVKRKGKGGEARKRPETGLAELAGTEATAPSTPPDSAGVPQDPATPASGADEPSPDVAEGDASETTTASEARPESPSPRQAPTPEEAEPPRTDLDSPAASLGILAAAATGSANRPTSKLVDPDTALVLDGGRVEVCSPLGWTRSPRSQNYLVRYQPGPRKSFPSIVVMAEPAPAGLDAIDAGNQGDLVAAIGAKLAEAFPADGVLKPIKKPAAATFGPHAGVAWAMPGTAKVSGLSETIERFAYGVVLGGRLYTVEARAPKGKVDDDAKAAAKAVAATLFRPADAPVGPPEGSADPGPAQTAE